MMKLTTAIISMFLAVICAQANVTFRFSPSSHIDGPGSKPLMEKEISALLSEITAAGTEERDLNLSAVKMQEEARTRLCDLWENARFVCDKTSVIQKCLNDCQGYQVRGIFVTMKPVDDTYTQGINRELVVTLNHANEITGVRLALEDQETVEKIMGEGTVADVRERRELLKFVEDFRCYYNERNLDALNKIFSDNSLIIVGSIIRKGRKAPDGTILESAKVKYSQLSKEEYLRNLSKVFDRNRRLDVKFDNISVAKNGSKPNSYGVTLHQTWTSSGYSDEGWLFLYWDLSTPGEPKIVVRTWQPEAIVDEHGVFDIHDFFIP